jgi:hypothetical protein
MIYHNIHFPHTSQTNLVSKNQAHKNTVMAVNKGLYDMKYSGKNTKFKYKNIIPFLLILAETHTHTVCDLQIAMSQLTDFHWNWYDNHAI